MTVVDLAAPAASVAPFGTPGHDPVADVWARLRRPFDPAAVLAALTGLSPPVARRVVAVAVAGSAEADRLLDELPRTIRSLATSTTVHHERCRGELRGPVLWSETLSARASTYGDEHLYVCVTPSRAYDVDENRVLVAALVAVRDAAAVVVEHTPARDHGAADYRRIRRNGNDARRFAEHPSLAGVARVVPGGRALRRTRAGKKHQAYAPALALLARLANPLTPAEVRSWCDRRTRAQLWLLTGVLAGLEATGRAVPALRAPGGHLEAGPLTFHHPGLLGDGRSPSGLSVGGVVVDVPDVLVEPGRGRAGVVVSGPDDLPAAVAALAADWPPGTVSR